LGVRWDYDGEVSKTDGVYKSKFQMQPNAGKIPFSIQQWMEKNGGTHAVMATALVKKVVQRMMSKRGLKRRQNLSGVGGLQIT
jgi:hypothetical protein